ncbi:MAG TPA: adenylate/guanylate cyclase domain-containing protein [Gaiellaceae bacterium]|nr:adenylate/guanylate cyclase domain-containing protein [Gaiellaceae bacterium]
MAARKTVTVVFCDIANFTPLDEALDPEVMRGVMERYFEVVRGALERHGGTVEKFIGDAAMAVFGIPTAHDDDALRAVRAAIDMRTALGGLNKELERTHSVRLAIRTGVNTGEVVAGDPTDRQSFATGTAVATTQRLEAAARSGEILLGDSTYRLVSNAVLVEPLEPLTLKGKAKPVKAWRLLGVVEGAPAFPRRLDLPMVGRQDELAALRAELDAAARERRCRLATIVGPAGIGKSRLGNELFAGAGGRATTLVGRCLAYGEGITYWPLRGIVLSAAGSLSRSGIEEFVADAQDGELIAERLAGAVGTAEAPPSGEETFWAVRRFLEHLARERPVILGIDELQWAEPAFLDLLEYLVGWTRDAPVLILGLGRPELLETRPTWSGTSSLVVSLEPLSTDDSRRLVDVLGAGEIDEAERERILTGAEGNPLFVEQMLALAVEGGQSEAMPPSIQALLTARLDRLSQDERAAIERASVIGREFTAGAVGSLSGGEPVASSLLSLVRRDLIEPDRSLIPGDDGFRFRHVLIRDAAYLGLAKDSRAALHEQYADWLEQSAGDLDEIIGYHLEQAFHFRQELGGADVSLAQRSGERLAKAGRRAVTRGDLPAAVTLLARAVALLPDSHEERREILPMLGSALMGTGDFGRAERVLDEALETARSAGDQRLELRTVIEREFFRAFTSPESSVDEIVAVADSAIPLLEQLGDDLGLAKAWWLKSEVHVNACHWGARAECLERALHHARRAGDSGGAATISALLAQALHYGPAPVPQAIVRCEELLSHSRDSALTAAVSSTLAALRAMQREFDEARRLWADARSNYDELGLRLRRAARSLIPAEIETLAGNPEEAVRMLRWAHDILDEMGVVGLRATITAFLADALYEAGDPQGARRFAQAAEELGAADDLVTQVMWRIARSKLDGDSELAEEALRMANTTDYPDLKARALVAVGELEQARTIYEAKGNVAAAERLLARQGASS